MSAAAAIAGLGITEMGKVYGRTRDRLRRPRRSRSRSRTRDCGRGTSTGLLINGNHSSEMAPTLQFSLGLTDLTLISAMSAFGSTATTMLQYAALRDRRPARRTSSPACTPTRRCRAGGRSRSRRTTASASAPPASRACGLPTATTAPPTRCTRSPCDGTCTCSGPTTTSSVTIAVGAARVGADERRARRCAGR